MIGLTGDAKNSTAVWTTYLLARKKKDRKVKLISLLLFADFQDLHVYSMLKDNIFFLLVKWFCWKTFLANQQICLRGHRQEAKLITELYHGLPFGKYSIFSKLTILKINCFNMDCNRILQQQVVQILLFETAALQLYIKLASRIIDLIKDCCRLK